MKRILISPYSQYLRNDKRNPKNYPHWAELLNLLQDEGYSITQIGLFNEGALVRDFRADLTFKEIKRLLNEVDLFISVDTFLPHLAHTLGKRGIVIFAVSDPNIFGYSENINILKDRKYLREKQFDYWENCEFNPESFVEPEVVLEHVKAFR
jgi:ADP-heptose:LPS heptosyltransferase